VHLARLKGWKVGFPLSPYGQKGFRYAVLGARLGVHSNSAASNLQGGSASYFDDGARVRRKIVTAAAHCCTPRVEFLALSVVLRTELIAR
jgi:hypothetical protein